MHQGEMHFDNYSHLGHTETELFANMFQMKLRQIIEHTLNFAHLPNVDDIQHTGKSQLTMDSFIPYSEFHNQPESRVTMFILPPSGGGAESYFNNIVRHLPHFRLVVFNNKYLHSRTPSTFEELATFYISHIKQVQPQGPYNLLG